MQWGIYDKLLLAYIWVVLMPIKYWLLLGNTLIYISMYEYV